MLPEEGAFCLDSGVRLPPRLLARGARISKVALVPVSPLFRLVRGRSTSHRDEIQDSSEQADDEQEYR